MIADSFELPGGRRLRLRAASQELLEAARALAVELDERATVHATLELGGRPGFLKASPLEGLGPRLRWALRRAPRVREYANLEWLRARSFRAPRPLACGVTTRGGLPSHQWLVTGLVPDAVPLDDWLAHTSDVERRAARIEALGRELARMHALHFVHRDVYPRNLLVAPHEPGEGPPEDVRPVFLDAWRGGAGFSLRGPSWDLGCFFLDAPTLLREAERERLLRVYFAERAAQDRPVDVARFLAELVRAREVQVERVMRRPNRAHGAPSPSPWQPPPLERVTP